MTHDGPYPGPRSQPWSGRGSGEPYSEPADPWGDQPTAEAPEPGWGGHPASTPPALDSSATYQAPFGASALNAAPPGWGQPPPPRQRRNPPVMLLVVLLGMLACGGLGTTAWLLKERGDAAQGKVAASAPATSAPADQAVVPVPAGSADARFVKKGQCVRNENTPEKPEMKIVACASGTLEVLKRVDGRTTGEADAENKCSKVPNYTKWFFYDSELDSLDFVLCLRDR